MLLQRLRKQASRLMEQGEYETMKTGRILSALALAAVTTGAVWTGVGADTQAPAPQAVTAVAGQSVVAAGRDSYADIVKVVTPAVVTIHTEGRARVSPTQFGNDDDLFRRFFGEQFGQT